MIQRKIEIVFGKAKDIGIKTIHLEVVTKNEKAYGFMKRSDLETGIIIC